MLLINDKKQAFEANIATTFIWEKCDCKKDEKQIAKEVIAEIDAD